MSGLESPSRSLSGQDLSFLAWESKNRPMHIAVDASFDAPGDHPIRIEDLRRLIGPAAQAEAMLARRLERPRFGRAYWSETEAVSLETHIRALSDERRPLETPAALHARIVARPIHGGHPPWEIWLDDREDASSDTRLIFKFHHVIVDGIGGFSLLSRLLGAKPLTAFRNARKADQGQKSINRSQTMSREISEQSEPSSTASSSSKSLLRFVRNQLRRGPKTPLNGAVESHRNYHSVDLDPVAFKAARSEMAVSGNDLLLAIVSRATEHWLVDEMSSDPPRRLRAFCPVSVRTRNDTNGGNQISPWFVSLPLDGTPLQDRAHDIHKQTRGLRRSRGERGGQIMAMIVRRLGPWLARIGMMISAWQNSFQLVITNVPAPAMHWALEGGELTHMAAYPPLFPGQRVCFALLQYNDRMSLALHTGFKDRASSDRYAQLIEAEIRDLQKSYASPTDRPLRQGG